MYDSLLHNMFGTFVRNHNKTFELHFLKQYFFCEKNQNYKEQCIIVADFEL